MYLQSNLYHCQDAEKLFLSLQHHLYSPRKPWPEETICSASQLCYNKHIDCVLEISGIEGEKLHDFFSSFSSKMPRKEYELHTKITQVLADSLYFFMSSFN